MSTKLAALQSKLSASRLQTAAIEQEIAAAAADERRMAAERLTGLLGTVITPALIDLLLPTHSRQSCSETNRINGLHSSRSDEEVARCQRCAMLDIIDQGYWPEDVGFEFTLRAV